MSRESLKRAVDLAGGQTHLARGIRERLPESKIGQVHVWGWLTKAKFEVPPADVVLPIADFLEYQITPHELRPDLYPNPGDAMPHRIPAPIVEDRRKQEQRTGDRRTADLLNASLAAEDEEAA